MPVSRYAPAQAVVESGRSGRRAPEHSPSGENRRRTIAANRRPFRKGRIASAVRAGSKKTAFRPACISETAGEPCWTAQVIGDLAGFGALPRSVELSPANVTATAADPAARDHRVLHIRTTSRTTRR
jgi:hypothetical protein